MLKLLWECDTTTTVPGLEEGGGNIALSGGTPPETTLDTTPPSAHPSKPPIHPQHKSNNQNLSLSSSIT